jgi:parallel beta-helix repeat protein
MNRKCLAVGIILMFIGTAIIPTNGQKIEKLSLPMPRGNILYVGGSGPGNYTRIQDAIANASDGDTVYIYHGTYYEHNLVITKKINIIGENKETTIVCGQEMNIGISCCSDSISIRYLNVTQCNWTAILITSVRDITIRDVIITSNDFIGVQANYGVHTLIDNCTIENNMYGIWMSYCDNSLYSNNSFNYNWDCDIRDDEGPGTTIVNNIFKSNTYSEAIGIGESATTGILIYHNNFLANNTCLDSGHNHWDHGYPSGGNYWADYKGQDKFSGPGQNISGSDGIGDTPYLIPDAGNRDRYPFMKPSGWLRAPNPPTITGSSKGKTGKPYLYLFESDDAEGHDIWFFVDWGDGSNSSWLGPYASGTTIHLTHTWTEKMNYTIKAKAKDVNGLESNWSTLQVTMPLSYEPPHQPFLMWLFERFPYAFPILRHLFRL